MDVVQIESDAQKIGEGRPNFLQGLAWPGVDIVRQASEYWLDAWQRSILFLDVLRRRGNDHFEQVARVAPNVLNFQFELVLDGRQFERPVNYCLVRIVPGAGVEVDPNKRPFIVFDPRAGHGPGIGGMKHDSEIGVVLKEGHPCYFVGFLPHPVLGQTVEDVCRAEARFVEHVATLHPQADGKPCLIGNCQAGWQIAMMSAVHPDAVGPIILAGAPLSYWAGVHGKHSLRYLGGLLGGTWLTTLSGDLGNGIFDGAHLVANFENMNPSNTLWKKNYHVFANIDTESERFLEFEKWWGNPILLSAREMQFITDELFVGNRLSNGEMFFSDDVRIDLRSIKSPIVVFCSWGDDITPPQQALDWILDLYDDDEALEAAGQTIVYALHQSIGHLGIFVSAKVATKEHQELTQTIDLIDALPPGLYEAVFIEKAADTAHAELTSGNYIVRFERRSLTDIRTFGCNDAADEMCFSTVAKISEINQSLYRNFASPLVKAMITEQGAAWLRRLHPHRVRFEAFSDKNPWMRSIAGLAESIRSNRQAASPDNPFVALQEAVSNQIVGLLDSYRDLRDRAIEQFFLNGYGSTTFQALLGLRSDQAVARPRIGRDIAREAAAARDITQLDARIDAGGPIEAGLRALLYIGGGADHQAVDERVFATLRQFRREHAEIGQLSLAQFKTAVREQYLLLRHDEERALVAIPHLLASDAAASQAVWNAVRRAVEVSGDQSVGVAKRLAFMASLFGKSAEAPAIESASQGQRDNAAAAAPVSIARRPSQSRAGQSGAGQAGAGQAARRSEQPV